MSRPRIIWLGNSTQEPVPTLLNQLHRVAEVHLQRELQLLLVASRAVTTTPADFCIIHWEYAGQWSLKQLNELSQNWPLSTYVVVVGEWATSATRHGPLWSRAEQFSRSEFCVHLELAGEHFMSDLRMQQPLLTDRWDDRTLHRIKQSERKSSQYKVQCVSDSSEKNTLWKELLKVSDSFIQSDLVRHADELVGCSLHPLTEVLIIDTELPSELIRDWLQKINVQLRKIVILSSMLRQQDRDCFADIRNCYLLSKPTSWRLVDEILSV